MEPRARGAKGAGTQSVRPVVGFAPMERGDPTEVHECPSVALTEIGKEGR